MPLRRRCSGCCAHRPKVVVPGNRIMDYLRLCGQLLGGLRVLNSFNDTILFHQMQCSSLERILTAALSTASSLIPDTLRHDERARKAKHLDTVLKEFFATFKQAEMFVRQCYHIPTNTKEFWTRAVTLCTSTEALDVHVHNVVSCMCALVDCVELAAEDTLDDDDNHKRKLLHAKKYDKDFVNPKLFRWQFAGQYLVNDEVTNFGKLFGFDVNGLGNELKPKVAMLEKREQRIGEFVNRKLRHASGECSCGADAVNCLMMDLKEIQVRRRIGAGSFGEVKEVAWNGETLAMRHMFTNADVFLEEFATLSKLRHPNILESVGFVIDRERSECSVLTELMPRDLRAYVSENSSPRSRPPFTIQRAVDLMLQLARGMEYLHRHGVVHGALKVSNVMVKPGDGNVSVKISDYGLIRSNLLSSRFSSSNAEPLAWWRAPETGGIRPEDEASEGSFPSKYSEKSDVYSYGLLCYEILTGRPPYDAKSDAAKIRSGDKPLIPAEFPRYVSGFVRRCWNSDPKCRQTFSMACRVLRHIKRRLLVNGEAACDPEKVPTPDLFEIDGSLAKRMPEWDSAEFAEQVGNIPFQMFAFSVMEREKVDKFNAVTAGLKAKVANIEIEKENDEHSAETIEAVIQSLSSIAKLKAPKTPTVSASGSPLSRLPNNKKVVAAKAIEPRLARPTVPSRLSPAASQQRTCASTGRRKTTISSYWSN